MLKKINVLICGILIFQLVGCGTIMYPERKGQKDGRIDAGVAVLDGLGLLLFLIPGIIAFAVDFNNGTIYLPGVLGSSFDLDHMRQVRFDPKHTSASDIEQIIKEETDYTVKLDQPDMRIVKLDSTKKIKVQFAETLSNMTYDRIVLIR
jgi:hypothetical protein